MISLGAFNELPVTECSNHLRHCCGSTAWVNAMATARPYDSGSALLSHAHQLWWEASSTDWREAFAHHPPIGASAPELEKKFASSARQSLSEQSGMASASTTERTELVELNQRYLETFGYVFLICATGKSAQQMLAELKRRINNDADSELLEAAREHAQIMELRLLKLLDLTPSLSPLPLRSRKDAMASSIPTSLQASDIAKLERSVKGIYRRLYEVFPALQGDAVATRQPVHTVYGGAQIWKSNTTKRLGELAVANLQSYAPDAASFAAALGLSKSKDLQEKIYARVTTKLRDEPVEDFRIDFEDGYGNRPDAEEDAQAATAAYETAKGLREATLPPFIGIRIKPLSEELAKRSLRTLDIFLTTLVGESKGQLPPNFVVTLPKIMAREQVSLLADLLTTMEERLKLKQGSIPIELMVETTQSILNEDGGGAALLAMVQAAQGRCRGAHFGTYDYTASCDIVARHQTMANPVCDFAKHMMQVSLAGTGVWLSDGATNVMPVPVHRGEHLSAQHTTENRQSVQAAWLVAYKHIEHSLRTGFYQGWDLHPAQLPVRYAAVYQFFLENFASASERLSNFVGKAAQATLVGEIFDDAATGQGLLNYFLRALNCRAITEEEAISTGLSLAELRSRSFVKITAARRAGRPLGS